MSNKNLLAVINAHGMNLNEQFTIGDAHSTLYEHTQHQLSSLGIENALYLTDKDYDDIPCLTLQSDSFSSLIEQLNVWLADKEYQTLFYFWADSVFLNKTLNLDLLEMHRKYLADYSFADGYPQGLSAEIMKVNILSKLEPLSQQLKPHQSLIGRESFFHTLQIQINQFDIETLIAPIDQRPLRCELNLADKGNQQLLSSLATELSLSLASFIDADTASIQSIIATEKDLRTVPYFLQLQLTAKQYKAANFLPPHANDTVDTQTDLPLATVKTIIADLAALNEKAVIGLGYLNEIGLYPHLHATVSEILSYPQLSVIIETGGCGYDTDILDEILQLDKQRVSLILALESHSPAQIRLRRPQLDDTELQALLQLAQTLSQNHPTQVYWQTTRLQGFERDLEEFYAYCQQQKSQILIQKYNHFSLQLTEKKVVDLSPFERNQCWHLKRELLILADGDVPLCFNDSQKEQALGNINTQTLAELWTRGQRIYQQHLQGQLCSMCQKCDEYYTFNF